MVWAKRLAPVLGLPGLNHLLVWFFMAVGKDSAEYVIRGCRFLHLTGAPFPLRIGRHVAFRGSENIRLGNNITIFDNVYLNARLGTTNFVKIGSNSHLDVFTSVWGEGGVEIGEGCAIAAGVRIYSQSNQYADDPESSTIEQPIRYATVRIGRDVWIGANAVILPGVSIGDHSVIGAGAVVNKDVPANSVAVGSPARVIKQRGGGGR